MTSVPTVDGLRLDRRRLDRRNRSAASVRTAMQRGAALNLCYRNGRPTWQLTTGLSVAAEVAAIVTSDPRVVSVDNALFLDVPGQTWRWTDE